MKPQTFLSLISVLLLTACNRYYLPHSTNDVSAEKIQSYIGDNRNLILRQSYDVFEMKNVSLDKETNVIHCKVHKVSGFHTLYGRKNRKNYYYRPARPDNEVQNQVHLFTNQNVASDSITAVTLPISSISMVEELQFDQWKTSRQRTAIGVGVAVGIGAIVATIVTINVLHDFADWGN